MLRRSPPAPARVEPFPSVERKRGPTGDGPLVERDTVRGDIPIDVDAVAAAAAAAAAVAAAVVAVAVAALAAVVAGAFAAFRVVSPTGVKIKIVVLVKLFGDMHFVT